MTRLPTPFGSGRTRRRDAALRLHAARQRFDLSMVALRKAALDHIDRQHRVSLTLRATLARRVEQTEALL